MPRARPRFRWLLRIALVGAAVGLAMVTASHAPSHADALLSRVRVTALIAAGRFDEAESVAATALIGQDAHDPLDGQNLIAVCSWIEARIANGKGADPVTAQQAELSAERWLNRPTLMGQARSLVLRNLGYVQLSSGRIERAIVHFVEARDASQAPGDVVASLIGLGRARLESGAFDQAGTDLGQALSYLGDPPQDAVSLAIVLERLAYVAAARGDFASANRQLDRAEAALVRFPSHPVRAAVSNMRGLLEWLQARYDRSEALHREALETARRSLRPGHPDIATYLVELASAVERQNRIAESRDLLKEALEIAEGALGRQHTAVAGVLNDLALADMAEGQHSAARSLFERALAIMELQRGTDHFSVIPIVFNLGLVNQELGDFADARTHFEKSTQLWRHHFGAEHRHVALGLTAVGETLAAEGRLDAANRAYREALRIRRSALGDRHPDVAESLLALARVLEASGSTLRAMEAVKEALAIWRETRVSNVGYGRAMALAADLSVKLGDQRTARERYLEARSVLNPLVGPTHPDVVAVELGLLLMDASIPGNDRRPLIDRALVLAKHSRRRLRNVVSGLAERQALVFAAQSPRPLDVALSLMTREQRDSASATASIFDELVRSRAMVLDEMSSRAGMRTHSKTPELEALLHGLDGHRRRLAGLLVKPPEGLEPSILEQRLNDARLAQEAAERAYANAVQSTAVLLNHRDVGLSEIRAHLPGRTALVSYVRYRRYEGHTWREAYAALILVPHLAHVVGLSIGEADLVDRRVNEWRTRVATTLSPAAWQRAAGAAADDELIRLIWTPVLKHVQDADRVLVVPDGNLHLLNISALMNEAGRFLIESGPTVHYLSAERDVVQVDIKARPGRGLFALGRPLFRRSPEAEVTSPSAGDSDGCDSAASLQFEDLPGTAAEVEDIVSVWQKTEAGPTTVRLDAEANETAFKTSVQGHRVVHLATHAFVLDDSCRPRLRNRRGVGGLSANLVVPRVVNPLLRSGLALAQGQNNTTRHPEGDDGILLAEEIPGLNLAGTEWAVLSACETALGTLQAGEGILGLRRTFQIAGVRTVISSLWPVEDQATREWMRVLYEARFSEGRDTADSVRRASLRVLEARRSRGDSLAPFYWAAFVAAGDWR